MAKATFSSETRSKNLQRLRHETFDLAIVGGGITGAGIARDAASRGMKVALIEARDFAFGTSSRSSKLVHGGIRYLENLEFGLVFEALTERQLLFDLAPHLVHPLRFLLPLYKGGRVSMAKMGLGMWLYDALSLFEAPELHERLNEYETLRHLPILRRNGLMGSFIYSDAYMDDDRLVIETLRSANDMGSVLTNYVSVIGADLEDGKLTSLRCRDEMSQTEFTVRSTHFVGSLGPWTDLFGQKMLNPWTKNLRPTKGIHLTLDQNRLPLREAVVMAADAEKRIIFAIPRHEMIIIGTTDTNYEGDPAEVSTKSEDVTYLLKVVSDYFPGAQLRKEDILGCYAGVRPLIDDGSQTESGTSREHKIWTDPRNVTFVAGGKYTTYRRMAQEAVDQCLTVFPLEKRLQFSKSSTKSSLNPLASPVHLERALKNVPNYAKSSHLPESVVRRLAERHGLEIEDLLNGWQKGTSPSAWEIEARHAVHHTMCLSLEDFYFRRTHLFLAEKDHGLSLINRLADVFSEFLGWNSEQRTDQLHRLQTQMKSEMAWKNL